jgi:hypothetical protein
MRGSGRRADDGFTGHPDIDRDARPAAFTGSRVATQTLQLQLCNPPVSREIALACRLHDRVSKEKP